MADNGTPYVLTIEEKEIVRGRLMAKQGYKCPICGTSLRSNHRGGPVLDHCHEHGYVRATLCRVCNTGEGVIKTAAIRYGGGKLNHREWLAKLAKYLLDHKEPQHRYIYPETKKKVVKRKRKVVVK